jgi:hypothetical protein
LKVLKVIQGTLKRYDKNNKKDDERKQPDKQNLRVETNK